MYSIVSHYKLYNNSSDLIQYWVGVSIWYRFSNNLYQNFIMIRDMIECPIIRLSTHSWDINKNIYMYTYTRTNMESIIGHTQYLIPERIHRYGNDKILKVTGPCVFCSSLTCTSPGTSNTILSCCRLQTHLHIWKSFASNVRSLQ